MMQEEKEERRQMNWISPPSSPSVAVILVSSLPSSSSSCLLSCWCHSFLFLSSLSVCLSSLLPDSLHHHQKIWSSLTTKSEGESICIFIIWHRIPLLLPSSLSHSCLIRSWNSYQANTILYNYLVFGEDCVGKGYFFSFPLICSSPGVSAPMIPFSSLLSILLEQKKKNFIHQSIPLSFCSLSFFLFSNFPVALFDQTVLLSWCFTLWLSSSSHSLSPSHSSLPFFLPSFVASVALQMMLVSLMFCYSCMYFILYFGWKKRQERETTVFHSKHQSNHLIVVVVMNTLLCTICCFTPMIHCQWQKLNRRTTLMFSQNWRHKNHWCKMWLRKRVF